MKRENRKKILFGRDESYNNTLFRKAKEITCFKDSSTLDEIEEITINDKLNSSFLYKIDELLKSKPGIRVHVFLDDAREFYWSGISSVVDLSLTFEHLTGEVDLKGFTNLKKLIIGTSAGNSKDFLNSMGSLTQLEDLRMGGLIKSLEFTILCTP